MPVKKIIERHVQKAHRIWMTIGSLVAQAQIVKFDIVVLRYGPALLAVLTPRLQTSITYRCH